MERDLRDSTVKVRTNLSATFSYGIPHIDALVFADQQEQLCVDTDAV